MTRPAPPDGAVDTATSRHPSIVVLAFLASLGSTWSAVRFSGVQFSDACLVVWAVAVLLTAGPTAFRGAPRWLLLPVLTVSIALVLQLFLTPESRPFLGENVALLVRMLAATALVPAVIIASAHVRGPRALWATVQGWVVSAVVSVLAELWHLSGRSLPSFVFQGLESERGFGLTLHPNSFGLTCVIVLPFVLAGLRARGPIPSWMAWPTTALMVTGLLLADSRSALVVSAVIGVLAAGYLWTTSRAWHIGLPMTLLSIAAALVYGPTLVAGTRLSGSGSAAGSDALRAIARQEALTAIEASPIYGYQVSEVGAGVMALLGLLVAGGVIMAVGYFGYFAVTLLTLARRARDGDVLVALSVISILSFLAVGLAQTTTVERYTFWPVGIGLAAVAASGRHRGDHIAVAPEPVRASHRQTGRSAL